MNKPNRIFLTLCFAGAAFLGGYIYWTRTGVVDAPLGKSAASVNGDTASTSSKEVEPAILSMFTPIKETKGERRRVFFRYNGVDSHYGQLSFISDEAPNQTQHISNLTCDVAHVSGGRGLCLSAKRGMVTTYTATLFDAGTFQTIAQFPLKGVPSRCRVSRDGKFAALTVFVSGHGYESLDFSTQTLLIDAEHGQILADLEKFTVSREGKTISNKDFNFWGVTFTPDAQNFYATLSTNHEHFLVRGDIAKRSVELIHNNVECPSLSPDATRVAYKKRFIDEGRVVWQLHTLDLKTDKETPLAEKRSIDDQIEWLDQNQVLYTLPEVEAGSSASTNIWTAGADGVAPPKLFLRKAYSPSVTSAVASDLRR